MAGNLVNSPPTGWTLDWHQLSGSPGGWTASGGELTHAGADTSGCASDAFAVTSGELLFVAATGAGSIVGGARFRVAYGNSSTFTSAAVTASQDIVDAATFSAGGQTYDGFVEVPAAVSHARLVVYNLAAGACTWSNFKARRLSTLTEPSVRVEISFGRASNYTNNGVLTWIVGKANSDNQVNSSFLSPRGGSTPDVADWSDVTAAVRSVTINRGRRSRTDEFETGQCSVELDNQQRDFDPLFTGAGGDWVINGVSYVGTGRPLRVSLIDGDTGDAYPIFTGRTTSWTPRWSGFTGTVAVSAAESIAELNAPLPQASYASQRTDLLVGELLDALDWPASLRQLDTGNVTAPSVTLSGSVLSTLRLAATTERGRFYVTGSGSVRFQVAGTWRTSQVQAVLDPASTVGAFGLDYEQASIVYDLDLLRNRVAGTRVDGGSADLQVQDDVDSIVSYGVQPFDVQGLLFATNAEVRTWAQAVLAENAAPLARVDSIEVWPDVNPGWWGLLMWAEFGDRFTVKVEVPPAGSDVITQTVQLEAVSWDIKPPADGGVRARWTFVPA